MNRYYLCELVALALMEDVGTGDLSSQLTVPLKTQGRAQLIAREPLVLSGLSPAQEAFSQVNDEVVFTPMAADGDHIPAGGCIASIAGPAVSMLTAERVALNFLMRLSGVATLTDKYVQAAANPQVAVVDTRKTTPGLRILEKAAVVDGGGRNHRFSLADGILIKDNHIAAAGSITVAVSRARSAAPHTLKIEVEVDTLEQLKEALEAGADIIMLDNMGADKLRQAVAITKEKCGAGPKPILEASGGVNLTTIGALAQTGVNMISVGALTHSATAVDIGMDWD